VTAGLRYSYNGRFIKEIISCLSTGAITVTLYDAECHFSSSKRL